MGTLIGSDSVGANLQNLTLQWADVGAFAAADLALFFWAHVSTVTPPAEVTPPSGFTLEGFQADGVAVVSVWSRILAGSESGNLTFGHGGATRHTGILSVLRGYTGVHLVTGGTETGSDAVHPAPAATPSITDPHVLIASGERQTSGSSSATFPGGYTQLAVASAVGASGSFLSVAYEGSAGTISGSHASGVAINPGNITHDVASSEAPTLTVLLTPTGVSDTDLGTAFFAA